MSKRPKRKLKFCALIIAGMLSCLGIYHTKGFWKSWLGGHFITLVGRPVDGYHPFSFTYSNVSDIAVFVESVHVLSKDVRAGGGTPQTFRTSSIGYARNDCTPDALLGATADFTWWKKEFTDPDSPNPEPIDLSKRLSVSLPFPEFDEQQHAWRCYYTLQPDNTWVGQFEGVSVKPIGEKMPLHNLSLSVPEQQWVHFQFKNASGKQTFNNSSGGKLVTGDSETLLFIPPIANDKKFYGFAAHSHVGSIYRPQVGSKLVFKWGFPGGGREEILQEFELPEFSPEEKNWYCYFIFDEEAKWTAVYEGTAKLN